MLDCMDEFNYECIKFKKILLRVYIMKCLCENVVYVWLFVIGEL